MSHKYEQVTTYEKQDDGSILIKKKSYYEELKSVIKEKNGLCSGFKFA